MSLLRIARETRGLDPEGSEYVRVPLVLPPLLADSFIPPQIPGFYTYQQDLASFLAEFPLETNFRVLLWPLDLNEDGVIHCLTCGDSAIHVYPSRFLGFMVCSRFDALCEFNEPTCTDHPHLCRIMFRALSIENSLNGCRPNL